MACNAPRRGAELARGRRGAFEANLLARAEEEDHRVLDLRPVEVPQGQNQRRTADAIVERASGRTGAARRTKCFGMVTV